MREIKSGQSRSGNWNHTFLFLVIHFGKYKKKSTIINTNKSHWMGHNMTQLLEKLDGLIGVEIIVSCKSQRPSLFWNIQKESFTCWEYNILKHVTLYNPWPGFLYNILAAKWNGLPYLPLRDHVGSALWVESKIIYYRKINLLLFYHSYLVIMCFTIC